MKLASVIQLFTVDFCLHLSNNQQQAHLSLLCPTVNKWKTVVSARKLPPPSQHRQFVESETKLHGVMALSTRFPGISPYISENGRGGEVVGQRCVDAKVVKSICV